MGRKQSTKYVSGIITNFNPVNGHQTLSRRDFLKIAGLMGTGTFLGLYKSEVIEVFAQAAKEGKRLVWIQGQSDSGCTISLLQAVHPDVYDAVIQLGVQIPFQQTIMVSSGENAIQALETITPDILVVEGSVPVNGEGGWEAHACTIGERNGVPITMEEWTRELAGKTTTAVVAFGSCSAFGGIPHGKDFTGESPSNAKAVHEVLGSDYLTAAGLPVINIPGCPGHPDWLLIVLASALLGIIPELDDKGRPVDFFSNKIHDNCARRGWYDKGRFAKDLAETDMIHENCLWKVGCKGPETLSACSEYKWNGGVNVCMNAGAPCIGCMHPDFPDGPTSPFYVETEKVPTFLGINTDTAGKAMIGATAVGIAAHAVRRGVTKHYKPKEEEK
jgi:hydrogenase small subunit